MPNADVRAHARALPETTNRRAVLGAVLAAGAIGATTVLPAVASEPQLSAVDRRVLDLWRRRQRVWAARERISDQIAAARAQMPSWALPGQKYVCAKGEIFVPGIDDAFCVGWPEVRDLDHQPVDVLGRIIARPSAEDLCNQFRKDLNGAGIDDARARLTRALIALDERLKEQSAERERTGYARLSAKDEATANTFLDIEDEIRSHVKASVLAVAATILISIHHADEEEGVLQVYRASLAAIRPQLIDALAEEADRVLSEGEEEEART